MARAAADSSATPVACYCWVLAPPSVPIAEDPVAAYDSSRQNPACNHVVCTACGKEVRHQDDGAVRRYRCDCTSYDATGPHTPSTNEDHPGPYLPWKCGGHPVRALPTTIDGVEIAGRRDVLPLLRAAVLRPMSAEKPIEWLHRVRRILAHTEVAEAFPEGARAALLDPDPRVRCVALRMLPGAFEDDAVRDACRRIEEVLRSRPDLFVDVPCPYPVGFGVPEKTIEEQAMGILAMFGDRPGCDGSKPLVRAFLLRRPDAASVIERVARIDRPWLLANAGALLDAAPEEEGAALRIYHSLAIAASSDELPACFDRVDVRVVRAGALGKEATVEAVLRWMLEHDRAWAEAHLRVLLDNAAVNYARGYTVLLPGLVASGTKLTPDIIALLRERSVQRSYVQRAAVRALFAQDRAWVEANVPRELWPVDDARKS